MDLVVLGLVVLGLLLCAVIFVGGVMWIVIKEPKVSFNDKKYWTNEIEEQVVRPINENQVVMQPRNVFQGVVSVRKISDLKYGESDYSNNLFLLIIDADGRMWINKDAVLVNTWNDNHVKVIKALDGFAIDVSKCDEKQWIQSELGSQNKFWQERYYPVVQVDGLMED